MQARYPALPFAPSSSSPPPDLVFFLGQKEPQREGAMTRVVLARSPDSGSALTSSLPCPRPMVDADVELSAALAAVADAPEGTVREGCWLEK